MSDAGHALLIAPWRHRRAFGAEALVKKIRQWLDASFEETEEERMQRKGALKARFTVNLSPSLWQELQRLGILGVLLHGPHDAIGPLVS